MNNILERLQAFWTAITGDVLFAVSNVLFLIMFAILYFFIMKILVDNKSGKVVLLFVALMLFSGAIIVLNDNINGQIFMIVPIIFFISIFILFSVEIKRIIWKKKKSALSNLRHGIYYDEEKIGFCKDEIVKALQTMSKERTGALIVLSTGNVPSQILDSGVKIQSDISSALIESIFFPNTPLHDGAMVITGTKIVAAGCFLPLSQNADNIPKELGTRHRAAIGITETTDVITLIVSEETGVISICRAGKITRYANTTMLQKALDSYYWQR